METALKDRYILIAEDDADDRFLLQEAFKKNLFDDTLVFLNNGADVMQYLNEELSSNQQRLPYFLLLDLNMPKKDGRIVLNEIKQHDKLKKIPVIIFSTTNNEQQMRQCYELGANSYITKPSNFDSLSKIVAALRSYWLESYATLGTTFTN